MYWTPSKVLKIPGMGSDRSREHTNEADMRDLGYSIHDYIDGLERSNLYYQDLFPGPVLNGIKGFKEEPKEGDLVEISIKNHIYDGKLAKIVSRRGQIFTIELVFVTPANTLTKTVLRLEGAFLTVPGSIS